MQLPIGWTRHKNLIVFAVFFIIASALYADTLHAPFFLDDNPGIISNWDIKIPGLSWPAIKAAASSAPCPRRLIPNASFALNYYAGGLDPCRFRAVNVLIHVCCALALFVLGRLLFLTPALAGRQKHPELAAFLAALLFLVHPLAVNVAIYIVQRMASLAALFYTVSVIFYVKGRLSGRSGKTAFFFSASAIFFIAAIVSKENAVIMPITILVLEWFFFRDMDRRALLRILPVSALILGGVFLLGLFYTNFNLAHFFAENQGVTFYQRMLTQCRATCLYLSLVVMPLPSRMNLDWYLSTSSGLLHPLSTLLSAVFILALCCIAIYSARRHRLFSFSVLWFFINLIIEAVFPLDMMFEHRAYLPSMIFFLVFAGWLLNRMRLRYAVVAATAVCMALSAATVVRGRVFADEFSIWNDVMAKSPQNPRAYANLGLELLQRGRSGEALLLLEKGAAMFPEHPEILANLGMVLQERGQIGEALSIYGKVLHINFLLPGVHYNLGNIHAQLKDYEVAALAYQQAIRVDPHYTKAWINLGNVLLLMKRPGDAATCYRAALLICPGDAGARGNLAKALQIEKSAAGGVNPN